MQYIVKVQTSGKSKRREATGTLGCISWKHAQHVAAVLSEVSSDDYRTQALPLLKLHLPMVGSVLVEPEYIGDAIAELKRAQAEFEKELRP